MFIYCDYPFLSFGTNTFMIHIPGVADYSNRLKHFNKVRTSFWTCSSHACTGMGVTISFFILASFITQILFVFDINNCYFWYPSFLYLSEGENVMTTVQFEVCWLRDVGPNYLSNSCARHARSVRTLQLLQALYGFQCELKYTYSW